MNGVNGVLIKLNNYIIISFLLFNYSRIERYNSIIYIINKITAYGTNKSKKIK